MGLLFVIYTGWARIIMKEIFVIFDGLVMVRFRKSNFYVDIFNKFKINKALSNNLYISMHLKFGRYILNGHNMSKHY